MTSSSLGTLAGKFDFLEKYQDVSKELRTNEPCYAISSEWWANLKCLVELSLTEQDMLMGNPGPIDNLPLMETTPSFSGKYKEFLDSGGVNEPEELILGQIKHMHLRQKLRYVEDFELISAPFWRFLRDFFGGGPAIELIPERNSCHIEESSDLITHKQNRDLPKEVVVNLRGIKVLVSYQEDGMQQIKYIPPTLSVKELFKYLCKTFSLSSEDGLLLLTRGDETIELEKREVSVQEAGVIKGSHLLLLSQFSGNRNSINLTPIKKADENEDNDSTKANEGENSFVRDLFSQGSIDEGNYSTNSRNSIDSAKLSTGSTNHSQNTVEFSQFMFGDEDTMRDQATGFEMEDFGENQDFNSFGKSDMREIKEQTQVQLETLLKRSRQAVDRKKITLAFKTLQEIRANLAIIQHDWNLWANSHLTKKI